MMITLRVNNLDISAAEGSSVAAAILASDAESFRRSISGEPRFPLCGMGICFECRVSINDVKNLRSCQIKAENGMQINTNK